MKKRYPQPIGSIIRQAIEQSGSATTFDLQRASYLWTEIVGPQINRQTVRRWIDHDELHVVIASAALKNELSFMSTRLRDLINQAAGSPILSRVVIH
ncbi:MAG: DUF721 domain-containing protein [Muribaculaceae bacterium]|nr:DUF721 domain-containing protein [Muribaculaceae bacterium]